MTDFEAAIRKLKSSIDESGSELQKVYEWNKKFGEGSNAAKRRKQSPYMSMYI
jgi:hypothetical protein